MAKFRKPVTAKEANEIESKHVVGSINKTSKYSKSKVDSLDVKPSLDRMFKDRTNVPPSIYDRMKGITLVDKDGNSYKID